MRTLDQISEDVLRCAISWEPNAKLLGNISTEEIVLLASYYKKDNQSDVPFKEFLHNECKWVIKSFTPDCFNNSNDIVWSFDKFQLSRKYSIGAGKYNWDFVYTSSLTSYHCHFDNTIENPLLALNWIIDNNKVNNVVLAYLVGAK